MLKNNRIKFSLILFKYFKINKKNVNKKKLFFNRLNLKKKKNFAYLNKKSYIRKKYKRLRRTKKKKPLYNRKKIKHFLYYMKKYKKKIKNLGVKQKRKIIFLILDYYKKNNIYKISSIKNIAVLKYKTFGFKAFIKLRNILNKFVITKQQKKTPNLFSTNSLPTFFVNLSNKKNYKKKETNVLLEKFFNIKFRKKILKRKKKIKLKYNYIGRKKKKRLFKFLINKKFRKWFSMRYSKYRVYSIKQRQNINKIIFKNKLVKLLKMTKNKKPKNKIYLKKISHKKKITKKLKRKIVNMNKKKLQFYRNLKKNLYRKLFSFSVKKSLKKKRVLGKINIISKMNFYKTKRFKFIRFSFFKFKFKKKLNDFYSEYLKKFFRQNLKTKISVHFLISKRKILLKKKLKKKDFFYNKFIIKEEKSFYKNLTNMILKNETSRILKKPNYKIQSKYITKDFYKHTKKLRTFFTKKNIQIKIQKKKKKKLSQKKKTTERLKQKILNINRKKLKVYRNLKEKKKSRMHFEILQKKRNFSLLFRMNKKNSLIYRKKKKYNKYEYRRLKDLTKLLNLKKKIRSLKFFLFFSLVKKKVNIRKKKIRKIKYKSRKRIVTKKTKSKKPKFSLLLKKQEQHFLKKYKKKRRKKYKIRRFFFNNLNLSDLPLVLRSKKTFFNFINIETIENYFTKLIKIDDQITESLTDTDEEESEEEDFFENQMIEEKMQYVFNSKNFKRYYSKKKKNKIIKSYNIIREDLGNIDDYENDTSICEEIPYLLNEPFQTLLIFKFVTYRFFFTNISKQFKFKKINNIVYFFKLIKYFMKKIKQKRKYNLKYLKIIIK